MMFPPLVDSFGRIHTSLRVSVTDACNIRCRYCMPEFVKGFLAKDQLLSFEAIERIVQVLAKSGIKKVRLTGGEPLMRPNLGRLVKRLANIEGLEQIAMTTNGMLLPPIVRELADSGLTHVNISLDTIREESFRKMSRRSGIEQVIAGIESALPTNMVVRLNALVLRDINLEDCIPLVEFALERCLFIRFIEFMPLDADRQWSRDQVVTGDELRAILENRFGPLVPLERADPSQPATDFGFAGRTDRSGGVGFIDPVSKPFCESCNRLRLTAEGKVRNCLFGREEWDLRQAVESGASDEAIYAIVANCVGAKYASHGISTSQFLQPQRAMYQIGG